MVIPPARALCAAIMFHGLGAPLVRAFCATAPRQEAAYRGVASLAGRQGHLHSIRRLGGRLCMSSETSPVADKAASDSPTTERKEVNPGIVKGTDLQILLYPHPALRAENEEITEFDDGLKKLSREMFKVMYASEGVGLAAPQVGVNKRLMVFNPEGDAIHWLDEIVLVNPQVVALAKGKTMAEEGCLSFPGLGGQVERVKWVKIEALNVRGKKIKKKYTDWTARIFLHEFDHLDGTVYIDHLSPQEKEKVQPALDKLVSNFGEGGAL